MKYFGSPFSSNATRPSGPTVSSDRSAARVISGGPPPLRTASKKRALGAFDALASSVSRSERLARRALSFNPNLPDTYTIKYRAEDRAGNTAEVTRTIQVVDDVAPVVSLVGDIAVRRAGLSILSRVGLAELAVSNVDDYVDTAIELARNVDRLVALRKELRERMRASPLMNATAFARDIERLYRAMWIEWTRGQGS